MVWKRSSVRSRSGPSLRCSVSRRFEKQRRKIGTKGSKDPKSPHHSPLDSVGGHVRSTSGTVEIFYQGTRVASHVRSSKPYVASTNAAHRPKSHQQYLEWAPTRIIEWAGKVGPFTARLVESIMTSKPHPEMGYRSALGVIRLERKYGAERLEAASTRAVCLKLYRFQSVKSMLQSGLDRQRRSITSPTTSFRFTEPSE